LKIVKYCSALLSIAKHCKAWFPILVSKHAFQAWLLTMISKHDVVGGGKHAEWQLDIRGKVSTWLLFNTSGCRESSAGLDSRRNWSYLVSGYWAGAGPETWEKGQDNQELIQREVIFVFHLMSLALAPALVLLQFI
jgi:hypothetical protein